MPENTQGGPRWWHPALVMNLQFSILMAQTTAPSTASHMAEGAAACTKAAPRRPKAPPTTASHMAEGAAACTTAATSRPKLVAPSTASGMAEGAAACTTAATSRPKLVAPSTASHMAEGAAACTTAAALPHARASSAARATQSARARTAAKCRRLHRTLPAPPARASPSGVCSQMPAARTCTALPTCGAAAAPRA
jgi:hypothetical protein